MLLDSSETISVGQLNKLAKTLLENNMPICWINGEISGLRRYSHLYFDLKDAQGKISCVLFANVLSKIDFSLENGQKIEVRGKVTIYPQNGSYQINIERVRKIGIGELWEAYNRLLNKLKNEGLFNQEYKKSIPVFPQTIGIITSKEGSVIRDVVTTLKRRMPNISLIIYHSAVQGIDARMQIAKAISIANKRQEVDVLIICRGGGSMEDLWSFNEEIVAREVFTSHIPIISAIGHETDNTIIDFVADVRAPTPTGAAEIVAKSRLEWLEQINKFDYQLKQNFERKINLKKQQLDLYITSLKALNPINTVREKLFRINSYRQNLDNAISNLILKLYSKISQYNYRIKPKKIANLKSYKMRLINSDILLQNTIKRILRAKHLKALTRAKELELVNPTNILSRGYAIVKQTNGKILSSAQDVIPGQNLEIILKEDSIGVTVAVTKNGIIALSPTS